MDKQQRFLELRKIFNEVIEREVRAKFDGKPTKVTSYNVHGDMRFCGKYELLGDGDGSNEMIVQINGANYDHQAPTFIIHDADSASNVSYWLYLEHPNSEEERIGSYFRTEIEGEEFSMDIGDDMLENENFQKIIMQMFNDISPDKVEDVKDLIGC